METTIVNGRLPGSRISVHDVYYYQYKGRSRDEIASILNISIPQIEMAEQYIEAHRAAIHENYLYIEARNARGNPPEIEALLKKSRAKFLAKKEEILQRRRAEANGAGPAR